MMYFFWLIGAVLVLSIVAELIDVIRQHKSVSGYVTLSDRRAKLQKVLKEED